MRKAALMVVAGAVLLALGLGCGGVGGDREEKMAAKYGTTVSSFDKGGTPEVTKAPFDGMYYLYPTTPDGKPTSRTARMQISLKRGETIGFKPSPDDPTTAVIAVAGERETAIPNTTYRWLYKAPR